jgi:hypothetical protein
VKIVKNRLRMVSLLIVIVVLGVAAYAVAAASQPQRPFKARSFEVVTQEAILDGSECPVYAVNSVGSGTGTHLGDFTVVRRHCFTPPDHPAFAGQVIHDGTYEITAANGDKLWGTYSGALQPTEFGEQGPIRGIITSPSTIDGGTGRFAGAVGEYLAVGDYDLVADQGSFKFSGWISYGNR